MNMIQGQPIVFGPTPTNKSRLQMNPQLVKIQKREQTPRNPNLSPSSSMIRIDQSDGLSTKSVQVLPSRNTEKDTPSEQLRTLSEQLNLVINHNCKLEKDLQYYQSFGSQNQQLKKQLEEKDAQVFKLQSDIVNRQQQLQDLQVKFQQQTIKTQAQDVQLQHQSQQNTKLQQQLSELQTTAQAQKNEINSLYQESKDIEFNNSNKIIILLNENEKLSSILESSGQQIDNYQKSFRSGQKDQEENTKLRLQLKELQNQVSEQSYQTNQFNQHIQNLQSVVSDLTFKIQILCDENDRMAKEVDYQRQGQINESQEDIEYIAQENNRITQR